MRCRADEIADGRRDARRRAAPGADRRRLGAAARRSGRRRPPSRSSPSARSIGRSTCSPRRAGSGLAARARTPCSTACSSRMTDAEQSHFVRLLTGEMRQGANDGVVSDAIAKAAGVPAADVRRATMLLGSLAVAARRALDGRVARRRPHAARRRAADARVDVAVGGRGGRGHRPGERRVEARRHPRAGAQGGRRGAAVHARAERHHARAAERRRRAARRCRSTSIVLDGESLGVDEDGRPRRFQDTMSGLDTTSAFFFDVLHVDGDVADRRAAARHASRRSPRSCRQRLLLPVDRDRRRRGGRPLRARVDGRRPRGRDGEGARVDVPGRSARRHVAQGEAGAHGRPRRARRRVGARSSLRVAEQPAPRRAWRRRRS